MSRVPWNLDGGPVIIKSDHLQGLTVSATSRSSAARSAGRCTHPAGQQVGEDGEARRAEARPADHRVTPPEPPPSPHLPNRIHPAPPPTGATTRGRPTSYFKWCQYGNPRHFVGNYPVYGHTAPLAASGT